MRYGYAIPATSANLGPGFDSFGIALDLFNKFEAEAADAWSVSVEGEGKGLLFENERNQIVVAMKETFDRAGADIKASVYSHNKIPTGNGLGSSSTARLGGVLLARDLLEEAGFDRITDTEVFELATQLEGHPDNVAAALFGGFTICWTAAGKPHCTRFEPAKGLAAVVVPASGELLTQKARDMLPEVIPHEDAAYNVAHAGLLAASIVAGTPEHFSMALKDRLHEPYRSIEVSDLFAIHEILMDAGADGVALSGSGPTVIGLVSGADDEAAYTRAVKVAANASDAVHKLEGRLEPLPLNIVRTKPQRTES